MDELKEKFLDRVRVNERNGCWEWQGIKRNGFGRLLVGSRKDKSRHYLLAHRVAWELYNGKIPEGMEVQHKCDHPDCVNPEHLRLGTRKTRAMPRQMSWVTAEDNPPKESGNYLAYTKSGEYIVLPYSAKHRLFNCYDTNSKEVAEMTCIEVSHCAPLVAPRGFGDA